MPGHGFWDFLQSGIPEISVIFQGNKHVGRSIVSITIKSLYNHTVGTELILLLWGAYNLIEM